jgi:uncharacterized peroxidase-related enzyme
MFLPQPPETEATVRLQQADMADRGHVMNLTRLWAWRPDVFEGFAALRATLMKGSTLTQRDWGVLVCATAAGLGDSYCALAWGRTLAGAADTATAVSVLQDSQDGELTERDQALSRWARQVVKDPNSSSARDVGLLRAAGLSDREIFEATTFIAFRLAFSSVNDALGVQPDWEVAAAAPAEVRAAVDFGRPAASAPFKPAA